MHEITLCQNAVEIIQMFGNQNNASRVTAVWINVGAYSCVEPDSLRFCFELACRDTLAEGCVLHLDIPTAEGHCVDCQREIHLVSKGVLLCPCCGGRNIRLIADESMIIKRIEIE